jgi:spore germination cell wall hydrolase CwlJ-like protein
MRASTRILTFDPLRNWQGIRLRFGPVIALLASLPSVAAMAADVGPTLPETRDAAVACMASAIAYEAGTEPTQGQAAVAQVILNRMRHPAFPKSVCGVVYQGSTRRTGCQFTFTCDGSLARRLSARTRNAALAVATLAIDGRLPGTIGSATHYHANYVLPRWASALVRVDSIGAHIFYRFPGRAVGGVPDRTAFAPPRPEAGQFRPWGLSPQLPPVTTDGS